MGKIHAICISEARGTQKTEIPAANLIAGFGIENDAHAGDWHRQVSLLSFEKIEAFKLKGAKVDFGAFGENIVVDGIDFAKLEIGALLKSGDVILKLTQKGKECHSHCQIYKQMGDCIMPREGVFATVEQGGKLTVGDVLEVL